MSRHTRTGGRGTGRKASSRFGAWAILVVLSFMFPQAQAQAPDALIVYGDSSFPPYESLVGGRPVGANVDLWHAIGRVLQRPIDLRLGPWSDSQQKVIDGAGHALTFVAINDERERLYDFTRPTFTFRFPLFLRADDVAGFDIHNLSGKRIAVKSGGFPASILSATSPEAVPVVVDSVVDAFRMLLRGEVAGVIESEWVGYDLLRLHGFVGVAATPDALATRTAHIAVPKGNRALVEDLDRAVKILSDIGELDRIADRWAGTNYVRWERRAFQQIAIVAAIGITGVVAAAIIFYVVRIRRSNRELRHEIFIRQEAEAKLTAAQEATRAIMDHSVDGLVTFDQNGIVLSFSKPAERIFGHAEADVVGRHISILTPAATRPGRGAPASSGGLPFDLGRNARTGREMQGRHRNGTLFPMDFAVGEIPGEPGNRRFVATVRDITRRKLAQVQLEQAQKMEAIGQLAGGIAHDFNNILSGIAGFAGFLREDLEKGTPQHGYAERIAGAVSRAKDLTRQILDFSRQSKLDREPSDLGRLVTETRELLRGSFPTTTEIETTVAREKIVAKVNPGQFAQVLLNLCVNANDALAGKAGRISIELVRIGPRDTDHFGFRSNELPRHGGAFPAEGRVFLGALDPERSYARLIVADTGSGMSPDLLKRIFDPFFTTKGRGQGTGLGLSVVQGIVMNYEGASIVASRPGTGTMFVIYIPLTGEDIPAVAVPLADISRGSERILIVDDDIDITDTLTIGLRRLGYDTTAMNDPEQAIAALTADSGAWDIVISDQAMPGMSGDALFARLKAIKPALRFILCSGFSDASSERAARAAGVDAFLLKPVTAEQLGACIREMYDMRPAAAQAV